MPDTNHLIASSFNTATYIINSTPYFPKFTEVDGQIQIKFNAAYIYDYANGGQKVAVGNLEHTVGQGESKTFQLEIEVDHKSGGIAGAKVTDAANGTNIQNFFIENAIDGEGSAQSPAYVTLDLAQIQGTDVKELFIRENIHWYYRAWRQGGGVGDSFNGTVTAILDTTASSSANGITIARALVAPYEVNDVRNKLSITQDGENIQFFVPDDDSSESNGGGN